MTRQGKHRREYACIFKVFDAVSAEIRPLKPAGLRSPSPYAAARRAKLFVSRNVQRIRTKANPLNISLLYKLDSTGRAQGPPLGGATSLVGSDPQIALDLLCRSAEASGDAPLCECPGFFAISRILQQTLYVLGRRSALFIGKPTHVETNLFSFQVFVCITAAIKADQGKAFVQVEIHRIDIG